MALDVAPVLARDTLRRTIEDSRTSLFQTQRFTTVSQCILTKNGQQGNSPTTFMTISWEAAYYDPDFMQSGWSILIPYTGWWSVTCKGTWEGTNRGTRRMTRIWKNAVGPIANILAGVETGANSSPSHVVTAEALLLQGEIVFATAWHDDTLANLAWGTDSTTSSAGHCSLSARYLGG